MNLLTKSGQHLTFMLPAFFISVSTTKTVPIHEKYRYYEKILLLQ